MPRNAIELPPITLSEFDGVRYLHLGSVWVQGAMRIKKPQVVELDYVQRMLASLLWLPTSELGRGQAVQLGLGAGAITRFTANALKMPTTAVEINGDVIRANSLYFALPESAELVCGDAADWLAQADPGSVQLLHVDLYDQEAAAPVLDDADFYAACRRVLAPGGLMSVNLFGPRRQLRGQHRPHRPGLRLGPGLEPAPHAGRQHRGGGRAGGGSARARGPDPARRGHRRPLGRSRTAGPASGCAWCVPTPPEPAVEACFPAGLAYVETTAGPWGRLPRIRRQANPRGDWQ